MSLLALLLFLSAILRIFVAHSSLEPLIFLSEACVSALPDQSLHRAALSSLICGSPVRDPELLAALRQTGLLHLFVISGSHLVALSQLLLWIRAPWLARWGALGLLTGFSGAQPPVVRAFVAVTLAAVPRGHTRRDLQVFLAGLATLAINPPWIHSFSLALSWSAAWALSVDVGRGWRGAMKQAILIWAALAPLLAPWGLTSPISWLFNLLAAPIFSFVSLPLAAIAMFDGTFTKPFDFFMQGFLAFVHFAGSSEVIVTKGELSSPDWFWVWISTLHVIGHVWWTSERRAGT